MPDAVGLVGALALVGQPQRSDNLADGGAVLNVDDESNFSTSEGLNLSGVRNAGGGGEARGIALESERALKSCTRDTNFELFCPPPRPRQ